MYACLTYIPDDKIPRPVVLVVLITPRTGAESIYFDRTPKVINKLLLSRCTKIDVSVYNMIYKIVEYHII